jgi:hypothetical protein
LNITAIEMTNGTVKTLLAGRTLRAPIALLAALAWLAVSNHCALASFAGSAGMTAAPTCHGMHDSPAPAKQKKEGAVECCKVLRATLPSLAKNLIAQPASSFAIQTWVVALAWMSEEPRLIQPLELDTGPPESASFAEMVLQRSLRAHAPPA